MPAPYDCRKDHYKNDQKACKNEAVAETLLYGIFNKYGVDHQKDHSCNICQEKRENPNKNDGPPYSRTVSGITQKLLHEHPLFRKRKEKIQNTQSVPPVSAFPYQKKEDQIRSRSMPDINSKQI